MSDFLPIPDNSFEAQYTRILEVAEYKTQLQLSEFLGIRQALISDAKRRNTTPAEWFIMLSEKKEVSPDWIRPSTGPKYLALANAKQNLPHVAKIVEVRPRAECSAQDLVTELVRRALQTDGIRELQRQIAESWVPMPIIKIDPKG